MSRTAEYERQYPVMLQEEKEKLEKEVAALRKKRKDEGRFLEIDREKKHLAQLVEESAQTIENARIKASDIIMGANSRADSVFAKAKDEADKMIKDAEKARNMAQKYESMMKEKLDSIAAEMDKLESKATELATKERQFEETVKFSRGVAASAIEALKKV